MTYTTQAQVRAAFWKSHPYADAKRQHRDGDYKTDTRCAFVDYVDALARNGDISEKLAHRVTL